MRLPRFDCVYFSKLQLPVVKKMLSTEHTYWYFVKGSTYLCPADLLFGWIGFSSFAYIKIDYRLTRLIESKPV